jgi:heme/copper-type cytochrome/quinol oxidase subunit 4
VINRQSRRYLFGITGIWLLLGVQIGVHYAHAPWSALVPVALICALGEWLIMTLIFLRLKEEPWGFSAVLYPLLLLAVLLVGTLLLLLRVFFE